MFLRVCYYTIFTCCFSSVSYFLVLSFLHFFYPQQIASICRGACGFLHYYFVSNKFALNSSIIFIFDNFCLCLWVFLVRAWFWLFHFLIASFRSRLMWILVLCSFDYFIKFSSFSYPYFSCSSYFVFLTFNIFLSTSITV